MIFDKNSITGDGKISAQIEFTAEKLKLILSLLENKEWKFN